MNDTIEILHIEGRRSFRIIWYCEELNIPYNLKFIEGNVPSSLQAIRDTYPAMPLAPTVKIGGRYIVESGAIIDVLIARDPQRRLVPPVESDDFLLHTQWMHFAEGTFGSRAQMWRFVSIAMDVDISALPAGYRPNQPNGAIATSGIESWLALLVGPQGIFDTLEAHLAEFPYFGGSQFTAADIMMHYLIRGSKLLSGIDLNSFANIRQWKGKVEARPAFARTEAAATPSGSDEHGLPLGTPLPFSVTS